MNTQDFTVGAVLTVTSGVMLTSISDVYNVCDFMTNTQNMTHMLPSAAQWCKPFIFEQHPELVPWSDWASNAHFGEEREEIDANVDALVREVGADLGDTVTLTRPDAEYRCDPIGSLIAMMGRNNDV